MTEQASAEHSQAAEFTAQPRTLNTAHIVGLIIGAMTPLAVLVGTIPLAMALGGPSVTVLFIAVGVIIWLFCVGYVQMVQRINRPGAFYNYIARGLGRPAGVGGAMIATLAYPLGLIGAFAVNSVILQQMVVQLFGVELPWQVYILGGVIVVGVISYLGIDLSARVVFVIIVIEVIALLVLTGAIGISEGAAAFPLQVFSPSIFSVGQPAVAFIFAFLCFQGYESGALYAPEAKRPERTIPRALYIALAVLVLGYGLVSWALTGVTGIEGQQKAVGGNIGGFVFEVVRHYLGQPGIIYFSVGTFFSVMAIQIAITNFMSRYLYTLAAEDLLPAFLARRNRFNAPGSAIITLLTIGLVVIFGMSFIGLDPLTQISSVAFGIGALCTTILMMIASVSIFVYFLRRPAGERHWWKTQAAPVVATVLLIGALVIQIDGFSNITGTTEAWTSVLPWIIVLFALFGLGYGFWIKRYRPRTYRDLAAGDSAEEAAALRAARLQERAEKGSAAGD